MNLPNDVTRCAGQNCPLRQECERYVAEQQIDQYYSFIKPPYNNEKCDYHWPIGVPANVEE